MAFLDSSGLTRLWQHIVAKLGNKVDKETGKGLSTNDYTTAEKNKLAGIATNANNYTLPTASSTLGGVKTTSTITSTTALNVNGYDPVPIVDGIPYYTPVIISENSDMGGITVLTRDNSYSLPVGVSVGSETQPIYFVDGYPTETTYALEASVPADAKFTDTTYTAGNSGIAISGQKIYNKGILSLSQGTANGTIQYSFFNQQVNSITTGDLSIKGLDTAAYHSEDYFVPATRTINSKALSENISLTASDVGALSTTGGTLSGDLTVNGVISATSDINSNGGIYAKSQFYSTTNNYPGIILQDANENALAQFNANTSSGGYSDATIGVNSSAGWKYFIFKNDGIFIAPSDIISNGGILKTSKNSYPTLAFTNANGAYLTSMRVDTSNGSYGNALLTVYKSATESNTFTFGSSGNFRAYGTIYGSTMVAQTNTNPQLMLQNASGAPLGMLYMNTTTGAYSSAYLRVYSSASAYSTFNFSSDGKLSCGSLALSNALPISYGGTGSTTAAGACANIGALPKSGGVISGYLTIAKNTSPHLIFCNADHAYRAHFSIDTSDGSFGNVLLTVYSAASTTKAFSFGKDGFFRANGLCTNDTLLQMYEEDNAGVVSFGTVDYGDWKRLKMDGNGTLTFESNVVYSDGDSVIYSSSTPSTTVKGTIWLKPV